MKKQPVTLAIQTPCHEDWQKMTPAEQGRFCLSCQKTVMDFTGKTDREVAKFFEQGSANTCGRFRHDQLQRPLHVVQPTGFGIRLRALGIVVPGLLLSGWAQAQTDRHLMGKVACPRPNTTNVPSNLDDMSLVRNSLKMLVGDTVIVKDNARTVTGKVTDLETGEALIGATILIQGTNLGTTTDVDGGYSIQIPGNISDPVLEFNYTGYAVSQLYVTPGQHVANQAMHSGQMLLGEIVIIQKDQTLYNILRHKFRRIMDNLRAGIADRRAEKAVAKQQTWPTAEPTQAAVPAPSQPAEPTPFGALLVETYPNPFYTKLNLRFDSPQAERLTIRLFDMQGHMCFSQIHEAMKGPQLLTLEPPSVHLPPGQYLLEVSTEKALRFAGLVVRGGA